MKELQSTWDVGPQTAISLLELPVKPFTSPLKRNE